MKMKTVFWIVLAIAAGWAVWYFFIRKKTTTATTEKLYTGKGVLAIEDGDNAATTSAGDAMVDLVRFLNLPNVSISKESNIDPNIFEYAPMATGKTYYVAELAAIDAGAAPGATQAQKDAATTARAAMKFTPELSDRILELLGTKTIGEQSIKDLYKFANTETGTPPEKPKMGQIYTEFKNNPTKYPAYANPVPAT